MSNSLSKLKPAVAKSLAIWHDVVATKDFSALPSIVHPDAVLRSPIAINPYRSAEALIYALSSVIELFEDFLYHRELVSDDGLNVFLEFSARVGDKKCKGVDLVLFDEQGLILDFEIAMRPLNSMVALKEQMALRVGDRMPSFKSKD